MDRCNIEHKLHYAKLLCKGKVQMSGSLRPKQNCRMCSLECRLRTIRPCQRARDMPKKLAAKVHPRQRWFYAVAGERLTTVSGML
jgi:hypothetical protein